MNETEQAILRTILYGDIFSFPMTPSEIHHFLISSESCDAADITSALGTSPVLRDVLTQERGYVCCRGRESIVALRIGRAEASRRLMIQAQRHARWLARMPFVRMVGVTGALAMQNAAGLRDDIDYIIVTHSGRVWFARALTVVWVRVARLAGVTLCPNYVVAESSLEQHPHDLYIAHEVTQVVPLFGRELYEQFRSRNPWVAGLMANAHQPFHELPVYQPGRLWRSLKAAGEWCFGGRIGDWAEGWELRRKQRRFQQHIDANAHHAAQIDGQRAKGHFNNHGHPVLAQYRARVENLSPLIEPAIGD
jgi:hypothetical protein